MGHLDRVVMFCNYSSPIRLDIWHGQKTEFGTDPSFFPTQEVLDNLHGPFLGGLASEGPRLSMVNLDIPCFFHKKRLGWGATMVHFLPVWTWGAPEATACCGPLQS